MTCFRPMIRFIHCHVYWDNSTCPKRKHSPTKQRFELYHHVNTLNVVQSCDMKYQSRERSLWGSPPPWGKPSECLRAANREGQRASFLAQKKTATRAPHLYVCVC